MLNSIQVFFFHICLAFDRTFNILYVNAECNKIENRFASYSVTELPSNNFVHDVSVSVL
jgi:hypothetical protein